ncbi:MAG: hypothetical protein V4686_01880 [Patescibacteria group bacterium]
MKIPERILHFLQQKPTEVSLTEPFDLTNMPDLFQTITSGKETIEDLALAEWLTRVIESGQTNRLIMELCEFHIVQQTLALTEIE